MSERHSNQVAAESDLIFISIASYRDQQLTPTIADCLAKAAHPERLRFGICWQHGPEEDPIPFASDPSFQHAFRVLDVDYRESRGACWARAEIMKLYAGEPWFFQLDSHCRCAPGWDDALITMAQLTGSPRPVLSTYASPFTPADAHTREVLLGAPQLMGISSFDPSGLPELKPLEMRGWEALTRPRRARFLAGGYLFAPGTFVRDLPYDPDLYFFGEEIAMTLRAFTHGYDLFHPHRLLVWHDYVRSYARRHWDDHTTEAAKPWSDADTRSRDRVLRLLRGELTGPFALGSARTLAEYEAYAGLSFRHSKVQDDTRRSLEPPNPPAPPDWTDHLYPWIVRILIDPSRMSLFAFKDPAFWYVILQDADHNEIHRHDFPKHELAAFTGTEPRIALIVEFVSGIEPVYWTVWPVSRHFGWLSKLDGQLQEGDSAIVGEDEPDKDPGL